MADLDDETVIVSLPADGDPAITKIEGAKDDPVEDLKSQFQTLKSTLDTTTQRLSQTETAARETQQRLDRTTAELADAKTTAADSQMDTVVSGIAAADAEATAAEKDYVAAGEAGDFAAQARAQRKLAAAEARKVRLEEAKADLEDGRKVAPKVEARTEAPPARDSDPIEAVAKTMAPRAAAWIRSHPDFITDRTKNARMMATHYQALAELGNEAEGGDEYFARLDEMAKPAKKADPVPAKGDTQTSGRRPSSAAAPNGNVGGGMNGGATTVTLTRREVEAATDGTHIHNFSDPNGKFKKGDPIGVTEFARRKAIMQKEGHYTKEYNEQ